MTGRVKVTNPDIWAALHGRARDEGLTITAFVEQALKVALAPKVLATAEAPQLTVRVVGPTRVGLSCRTCQQPRGRCTCRHFDDPRWAE